MVELKEVSRSVAIKLIKRKYDKTKEHSFIIRIWDMKDNKILSTFESKDYQENINKIFMDTEKQIEKHDLYEEDIEIEYFIEDNSRFKLIPTARI